MPIVEQSPQVNDPHLTQGLRQLAQRTPGYALYRNYYRGEHRPIFGTPQWQTSFTDMFRQQFDNQCANVVNATRDKLRVTGFVPRFATTSTTDADDAMTIWKRNRMDQRAPEAHTEAGTAGDSYVLVGNDSAGRAVIWVNRADQVHVQYSTEVPGQVEWAVKVWTTSDGHTRANLYYPDRIEKFISGSAISSPLLPQPANAPMQLVQGGFQRFTDDADNGVWPLPHPFGRVPVFHFAANAQIGQLGVSDLHNVVPLQDALNKSVANMNVAGEFMAYPQRWATGFEAEYDDDGREVAFRPGPDRVWTVASEMTKFGQFDPADPGKFLAEQNAYRLEIASVSAVPPHRLGLDSASAGDSALGWRVKESAFTDKISARQVSFGNVWEDVLGYALVVERSLKVTANGPVFTTLAPTPDLEVQWAPSETTSAIELSQTVQMLRAAGLPLRYILTDVLGLTDQKANEVMEQLEAEQAEADERAAAVAARGVGARMRPMGDLAPARTATGDNRQDDSEDPADDSGQAA